MDFKPVSTPVRNYQSPVFRAGVSASPGVMKHEPTAGQGFWYGEQSTGVTTHPMKPVRIEPRFGHYCGVCPLCVAGMAAKMEVENIRKLRSGEDIEVNVGNASKRIREAASKKGVSAERSAVGNEDGTRLQPVSLETDKQGNKDWHALTIAALPRKYDTPDAQSYRIDGQKSGFSNGLFEIVTSGVVDASKVIRYPSGKDLPPPPLEYDSDLPIIEKFDHTRDGLVRGLHVKTFGLYHHLSEGIKESTKTGMSDPLFIGYTTLTQLEKNELLLASVREIPGFEDIGIDAGGLLNVLGLAARRQDLDSVAVVVEKWQKGLYLYLDRLKEKYEVPVQQLTVDPELAKKSGYAPMPDSYREFLKTAQMPPDAEIFVIPLTTLKEADKTLKKGQGKTLAPGELDTELLNTIAIADPKQPALLPTYRREVPPLGQCTISMGGLPDINDLPPLELPDDLDDAPDFNRKIRS